jgi:hypothetical protein
MMNHPLNTDASFLSFNTIFHNSPRLARLYEIMVMHPLVTLMPKKIIGCIPNRLLGCIFDLIILIENVGPTK